MDLPERVQSVESAFAFVQKHLLGTFLQRGANSSIQGHELVPAVMLGKTLCVQSIHPADVRALLVNAAPLQHRVVMLARAVATIQAAGFGRLVNTLAAQAALVAGER